MVLSRLTKITGPGVATDTNWVGNNADFTGITTTATSFNIGVTTIHSTLIEAHNIKSTGIITATGGSFSGNVTAVDGTFSGNVSIAGTLTYEDVTNIDSVGIITAPALDVDDFLDVGSNIKLGNAGVITATSFVGDGSGLIGVASTDNIVTGTAATFTGGVDINSDLDVDGHTNLDNVSIAGITTIAAGGKLSIGGAVPSKMLELYSGSTVASIHESAGASYVEAQFKNSARHYIVGLRPDQSSAFCILDNTSGSGGVLLKASGHTVTLDHDLNVDGHTNLDNVSIAGVTTTAGDLTVGSGGENSALGVRINSAYAQIKLPDGQTGANEKGTLFFGDGDDFTVVHDGYHNYVRSNNGWIIIKNSAGNNAVIIKGNNATEIYHTNSLKVFETTAKGIQVGTGVTIETNGQATFTGIVTASTYYGDGSNLSNITSTTINNNADNRVITGTGSANVLNAESNVHIDGSGRLLVGTSTNNAHANADNAVISGTGNIGLSIMSTDSGRSSIYFGDSSSSPGSYAGYIDFIHSSNSFNIGRGNDNSLTIDSNGYLGINQTPYARLDVKQDNAVAYDNTAQSITYNAARFLNTSGHQSGGTYTGFQFNLTGNGQNRICSIGAISEASNSKNSSLVFHTDDNGNRTEKLRINSLGQISIKGTTTAFDTTGDLDSLQLYYEIDSGQASIGPYSSGGTTHLSFYTNNGGAAATEKLRITGSGRHGFNRSSPHYAMHLSPADGETRIDLHMTNSTTGHNSNDGVQFGYQNSAGAYIWNFENTPIYMGTNNVKKFEIHATGSTQIYKGDLLLGPDSVSQMEATIRAWGCSLWFTTIDSNYYHDSGGEFRQFYNKGSARGSNYLTAYNCPIQGSVGPQNRVFWRGANNDTRAEGTVNVSVGYRGAWFFINRASCTAIPYQGNGRYLYDSNSPSRVSVSFDSFGNSIESGELSFHCGTSAGYNSGNGTIGGRLGSSGSDSTLRMYCVGVNMENYNAPNNKRAGNHLGVSVINEDGTDYGSSRLSENLINNSTTGSTNSGSDGGTEFNWGNRHSNDRGSTSNFQFSQIMYFDDIQLNSSQWDYLEHYFKVMYGNG